MSTLIRQDGTVLLLQVYRDHLDHAKPSQLRHALRKLSEDQGRYLRIQPVRTGYEIAVDRNVGYLLGESIAEHFSPVNNLIYCEEMESSDALVLIVIRDGLVQLDTLVQPAQLLHELLPVAVDNTTYSFYYHLKDGRQALELLSDHSPLPAVTELFSQAELVGESLINSLPISLTTQVLPCERAIQQSSFSSVNQRLALTAVLSLVLLGWGASAFFSKPAERIPVHAQVNQYIPFYKGVAEDNGEQVMRSTIVALVGLGQESLQGFSEVSYSQGQLKLSFDQNTTQLSDLHQWSQVHHFHLSMSGSSLQLTQDIKPTVHPIKKIYSVNSIYAFLSDHLRAIESGKALRIRGTQSFTHWKTLQCVWPVSNLTLVDLRWFLKLLHRAPVSIDHLQLVYHAGVMRGRIHLTIWGT